MGISEIIHAKRKRPAHKINIDNDHYYYLKKLYISLVKHNIVKLHHFPAASLYLPLLHKQIVKKEV